TMSHLLYLRFGVASELMIKSPYYCFFAEAMWTSGLCKKFIFMRRNLDSVAASMISHRYVGKQLNGPLEHFFDLAIAKRNIEIENMECDVLKHFVSNYGRLSLFDRGLFKAFCFSVAFAGHRKKIPSDNIFIFEYDSYREDRSAQRNLQEFVVLNDDQNDKMV